MWETNQRKENKILLYRKEIIFREHAAKLDIFQDLIELLFYLTTVLNAGLFDEFKKTGKRPKVQGPLYLYCSSKITII
ncbi:MAG: hypothetical protein SCH66_07055 [Methanolobus sp.]|nr:hypothetical protein [Methanolobus sp.]